MEGKVPAVPELVGVEHTEEDLTVLEGENKSVEWWEEVNFFLSRK